jgi:hypothetical protein
MAFYFTTNIFVKPRVEELTHLRLDGLQMR